MSKKVTLSKTFANEAEYQHFQKLYDANTSAFENVWHLEVEGQVSEPAAPTLKETVLAKFIEKVEALSTELEITVEAAWEKVHAEMTEGENDEAATKAQVAADPVEKTEGPAENASEGSEAPGTAEGEKQEETSSETAKAA